MLPLGEYVAYALCFRRQTTPTDDDIGGPVIIAIIRLYRMTFQWDKKPAAGGPSRSKAAVSSPAASRKSGYQLAPMMDDSGQGESYGQRKNVEETSYILDERPPVEGRDSLGKDKVDDEGDVTQRSGNDEVQSASYVPPTRSNIATVRQLRPNVEPLPLNDELQSPGSRDVSPFTKTPLFTDERSESPLSDVVADDDDFEYDDYLPQLPGSYFTMDPQAYTLTWSKQPRWLHQPVTSSTAGDVSVDQSNTTSEQQ